MNIIKEKIKKLVTNTKNIAIICEGIVIALLLGTTIGLGVNSSKFHSSYKKESDTVEQYKENENSLVRSIASLNRQNQEAKDELEDLQTQLIDLQTQYEELEENHEELSNEKEVLERDTATLKNQIRTNQTSLESLQTQLIDLQTQYDLLNEDNGELAGEKEALESQITSLQTQISNKETTITSLESQLSDLQAQYDELEQDNVDLVSEKETLESQITSLQTQISNKETTIASLESQISDLQTQLTAATAQANLCSVFFVYNDTLIENKVVSKNSTVTYPTTPTVEGKFCKWHDVGTITSDKVVFLDVYDASVELTGSCVVGATLTADVANYTKQLDLTYTWYKVSSSNEETILDEDEKSLVLDDSHVGYKIKVEVTATGCTGKGSKTSNEVTNPITGTIEFTGDAVVGSYIISTIETNASTYLMQWYRGNEAIAGETNYSHEVTLDDCGKVLKLIVTPTDEHTGTLQKETTVVPNMSIDSFYETYMESFLSSSDDCVYDSLVSADTSDAKLKKYVSYKWFVNNVEVDDATSAYFGIFDTSWIGKSLKVRITGQLSVVGTKDIELTSAISPAALPNDASISMSTEGCVNLNYYMSSSCCDIDWYIDGEKYSTNNVYYDLSHASDIGKEVYVKITGKNGYSGTITTNTINVVHIINNWSAIMICYDDCSNEIEAVSLYDILSYCTVEWSYDETVISTQVNFVLPVEYRGKNIKLTVTGDGEHVSGTLTKTQVCGESTPV